MRKPFNAAQGGFLAIFRLKDDFRSGFGTTPLCRGMPNFSGKSLRILAMIFS